MAVSNDKFMLIDKEDADLFENICVYSRFDGHNWYCGCTIDRKTH